MDGNEVRDGSWLKILVSGITGILIGIVILHPAAMFIMDFRSDSPHFNWHVLKMTFSVEHFPMTVYFAYLGAFIGVFFGLLNTKLLAARKRLHLLENALTICPVCRKILSRDGSWASVEKYFSQHTDAQLHDRICESCEKKHFPRKTGEQGGCCPR